MNFDNAQKFCRLLNMSLPVPMDDEENDFFTNLGGSFLNLVLDLDCPNKPYRYNDTGHCNGYKKYYS